MSHRIGVLLSGRGSNFEALADSIAAGRIPGAEIALVISNREGAPGLARAAARGIAGSRVGSCASRAPVAGQIEAAPSSAADDRSIARA